MTPGTERWDTPDALTGRNRRVALRLTVFMAALYGLAIVGVLVLN